MEGGKMNLKDKIFIVFVEGKQSPSLPHYNQDEAIEEAERLCRKENLKVYLFKAIKVVTPVAPPTVWNSID